MLAEVYLDSYLEPFAPFLAADDVTDIYVNRPGEVWTERLGGTIERHEVPSLTIRALERLARQVAASTAQGINREHPLLAGALPDGSRIQIALPPATRGEPAIAIRRHISASLSLTEIAAGGAFARTTVNAATDKRHSIHETVAPENIETFLRDAVKARRNILVSGGTSTGKTTFLNALLAEVPPEERLIIIEDTPELHLTHANAVGLLAVRGSLGEAEVSAEDLLIASLRMRPDRIILGEIRGGEALTFLRAINTGHPGSLSSIHADSPERAVEQLALLVLQSGGRLGWEDVQVYIRASLDIIVQLERSSGERRVGHVWMAKKI